MKQIAKGVAYVLLLVAIVALAVCVERYRQSMYAEAVANEIERREQSRNAK